MKRDRWTVRFTAEGWKRLKLTGGTTMAICTYCNLEMCIGVTPNSCIKEPVIINGERFEPVVHIGTDRCHDCNVSPGGYHHPGCDKERCPSCGGQLISCGCADEDEE